MTGINAYSVYTVNACGVNAVTHAPVVGKRAASKPSEFWQRLAKAWEKQGLPTSQNGVATRLNMSQGSTRRWYTGEGYPEIEQLKEIARLGKCSIHWLLTNEGPESVNLDPDTAALLRHWAILTPEARTTVLRTARGEHAMQFTGDPEARKAFQKKLEEHSNGYRVHDREKSGK